MSTDIQIEPPIANEQHWVTLGQKLRDAQTLKEITEIERIILHDMTRLVGLIRLAPIFHRPQRWFRAHLELPFNGRWNRLVSLFAMEIENANQGHFGLVPYDPQWLENQWRLSGLMDQRP